MRSFIPVYQPKGSVLCGQACVAMISGVPLKTAIDVIGHICTTHTNELISALRRLNVQCDSKLRRPSAQKPFPPFAILKISFPGKRNWHWVVRWNGKIYDPDPDLNFAQNAYGIASSFLEVYPETYIQNYTSWGFPVDSIGSIG